MKLVELLAKELAEWPENVVVYFQWGNGEVFATSKGFPTEYNDGMWYVVGSDIEMAYNAPMYDKKLDLADDHDTANVNRAQWQAERDRQKGGEWKRHRGGKCPVPAGTKVSTRHRNGEVVDVHFHTATTGSGPATMNTIWKHTGDDHDIMQYKVISQPQAEEVEVNVFVGKDVKIEYAYAQEGVEPEHLEWKTMGTAKIDSICDLGSTEAKTDQIDGPIKWRDTVNELDAYIEEFTREREELIERLASEGFELIPPVVSVMSEFEGVNMGDWRNWKAGDLVTYDHTSSSNFTSGKQYTLSRVDERRLSIDCDDAGDDNGWLTKYFKWHSRP